MNPEKLTYLGDKSILDRFKTAFFCSRKCPSDIVLKSLDWAKEKKEKGECIMSGFHSRIEKDVFDILLQGAQPIILVLARGMKKKWPEKIKSAIKSKRLLIISPFDESVTYVTQQTANKRNKIMTSLADEVFIAYSSKVGHINKLVSNLDPNIIITFP